MSEFQDFQEYVSKKIEYANQNPSAECVNDILGCAMMSMEQFKNKEYAFELSSYCKNMCSYLILGEKYDIYQMLDFSDYCKSNNMTVKELDAWWKCILFEAQNVCLDSYLLYIEKNREVKDRFYQPRRKCFTKIGLISSLQDMLDDKLDLLSISLPPGTGKLLADDTPVLTTNGWKNHGDLVVGDYVYGLDGKPKKVQHIFPKDYADCLITFSNGQQIQCHENHEWVVCDNKNGGIRIRETKEIEKQLIFCDCDGEHSRWFLPKRDSIKNGKPLIGITIIKVERVKPKQGNCIQVEDGVYCVGKTMIPTHNSTLEKFLHSAICGWFPEDYNLFFSHSAGITRMYYDGVLSILTDELEYTWKEIFPECEITGTNAKMEQINVGTYKPFPNLQTASVGSEMAGKVRASKFLLVDDMIGKIEEALNKSVLEKLWNIYSTDARQRKVTGCKEIHISTRWSVADIIGRLQSIYKDNDRCKFIAIPDINPETGESNFAFDINPFTVEFYHDQELLMDEISYRCLYKNDPIEREGLLYAEDSLRRYASLPNREPDAILGVCDTKTTGIDYMVLLVMYQYDNDFYLVDCICDNNTDFGVQQGRLSDIIVNHKMQQCEFESNAGGSRLAFEIDKMVKDKGGMCNITTKPTETNKETRIIVNSDWIKKNVLFREKGDYTAKSDYGRFMDFVLSYSVTGKNKFDDCVDCLANFKLFIENKFRRSNTAVIIKSPF